MRSMHAVDGACFLLAVMVEEDQSSWWFWPANGPFSQPWLNTRDDRSTRFLWTKKYRIGQPHYKTISWREFSITPGLFSRKNLLLCHMQVNNYGLLVKTIKKSPKSPIYCRGFTSNLLAERRGTRYLSLHLVVLYSLQQLICNKPQLLSTNSTS